MEYRKFGRIGHESSVLAYGAASLWTCDQDVADASLRQALDAGINSLDTAASYGLAEERMGPMMPAIRDQVFLATKSGQRKAEDAWAELNRSLELLGVDHIDLWQVHAVCAMDELDECFAPGGAIEAFQRAKVEGIVDWLGITGHTEQAPYVHLEGLRRFDFDSVLTPLNWKLWQDAEFRSGFEALADEIATRNVGLRTIKAVAPRPYNEGEQQYQTWYRPFDQQQRTTAAISWVLGNFPQVTAIATAGETTLLAQAIEAEANRMDVDEAAEILAAVDDYASPFSVPAR